MKPYRPIRPHPKMAIRYSSTSAPARLDDLLQVPLKVIPLEDFLLEKPGSVPPSISTYSHDKGPPVGNRLCHSADSPLTTSPYFAPSNNTLYKGRIHPDKQKSFSSPCLFQCCKTPSQWNRAGPQSNTSTFRSAAVKLPNGKIAVVPVMNCNEDAKTQGLPVNEAMRGNINNSSPNSPESESTERSLNELAGSRGGESVRGFDNLLEAYNEIQSPSRNSEGNNRSSSSVILGKVTDSPKRYADFLTAQASGESNNNTTKNPTEYSNRPVRGDDSEATGEDPNAIRISEAALEEHTLKLTFYNDGRKQSVKEFRTSLESGGAVGGDNGVSAGDTRCFENQHGLQLSRVLRGIDQPENHSRHGAFNGDNTQQYNKPLPSTRNLNSGSTSTEKAWEQWSGLQISRCQKDSTGRLISGDVENNRRGENSEQSQNNNNKGENESLIDRHLQSVLTSLRYVRPNMSAVGSREIGNRAPLGSTSAEAINSAESYIAAEKSLKSGEVDRAGGIVLLSHPQSPSQIGAASIAQISPQVPRNASQLNKSSPPEQWPERRIARIPTRPYLSKNITYEQRPPSTITQGVDSPLLNHQQFYNQQPNTVMGSHSSSSYHSPPKRFKPGNMPLNQAGSAISLQQQQHHGFAQNVTRYPIITSNLPGPSGSNGYADQYQRNSIQPLAAVASDSRSAILPYGNIQQQNMNNARGGATPFGNKSPSSLRSVGNVESPYRSPVLTAEQSQANSRFSSQNPNFHQSLMIAAAVAVNSSSSEPVDQNDYYKRLQAYYEYYQNQQLDWTKLTEYYQKFQYYPWDAPSGQDDPLARQWRAQHQRRNEERIGQELESMAQHKLALRAMESAGHSGATGAAATNKRSSHPYIHPTNAVFHGKTGKAIEFSASQAAPAATLQNIQTTYNPANQPMQQLQQIQARQLQNQMQHHVRYQQEPQHAYPLQQQQQYAHSQNQGRVQQAGNLPANFDFQNSPNYRNAYNQLAAAAAAVASPALGNNSRIGMSDMAQSQLRSHHVSNNNITLAAGAAIAPSQNNGNVNRLYNHISNLNQHSIAAGVPGARRINPPHTVTSSNSSISKAAAYGPNIHRQTLELAIRNNFKSGDRGSLNMEPVQINNRMNTIGIARNVSQVSPVDSPPLQLQQTPLAQQRISKDISDGNIRGGAVNMIKEPLRTAPSPSLAQQTSVIRRVQPQHISPLNITLQKTAAENMSSNQPLDMRSVLSLTANHRNNNNYSSNLNIRHEEIQKRKGNTLNNSNYEQSENNENSQGDNSQDSPIPLVTGEEEIVTLSVSPSAVLATTNSGDGGDDEPLDNERVEETEERGGNRGESGPWQYDHVVLLDKRTKTYMCKRCFETMKTEQEIRNHLFCKMLAGHVRCHVCLQLLKSEQYPEHLQVHGVRPPEEEEGGTGTVEEN